ncbi:MAG: 5'-methylthioadenosine/S-adenosylhomocysteine nucleosidase [Chloroflexota bacterium]|nr:5'-methylthioadenosine/S-adenosylhomocysteine nucleosidase [Chloroflexota bacterium]
MTSRSNRCGATDSVTSPLAIVCAMEWELAHLRRALPAGTEEWHDGQCAYVARLGRRPLVLVACGMGMVSAAAGTQAVISRYSPRAVLNYGCAGAHRAELLPGDLVVATHVVAYDSLRESPDGQLHYRGMHYLEAGQQRRTDALITDPGLLAAARHAADAFVKQHEPWPLLGWPPGVPHRSPRLVFGTVASADRWNRSPASIGALVARHNSLCEDMEAAAIGLVCAGHGVPFLSIKDVSNNELVRPTLSGQTMLAELGADQIARRAADFTLAVIGAFVS